jgi:putative membrane protein
MFFVRALFAGSGFLWLAPVADAHAGAHPVEGGPPGWTWDLSITGPLVLALAIWAAGHSRLMHQARGARPLLRRRAVLFLAGWALLAGSLISPLHEAGERSFTLHMVEHELIMLVAAPLLVLARPLASMAWAPPQAHRRRLVELGRSAGLARAWRTLSDPIVATTLQAAVLVAWHIPALFDRALGHFEWHVAQHGSFLASALLFWSAMFSARSSGVAAVCLFLTSLAEGALGALMSLSGSPWYAGYAALDMAPFGLTPETDQALAGLIMWIPGGLVHAGAALWMLSRYLGVEKTRAQLGS